MSTLSIIGIDGTSGARCERGPALSHVPGLLKLGAQSQQLNVALTIAGADDAPTLEPVFTLPTTSTPPVLALLVELLDDDRAAGHDWQAEQFAYTAWLACRESGAGRAWLKAIIETTPAWRDAYQDRVGGALERWEVASLAGL